MAAAARSDVVGFAPLAGRRPDRDIKLAASSILPFDGAGRRQAAALTQRQGCYAMASLLPAGSAVRQVKQCGISGFDPGGQRRDRRHRRRHCCDNRSAAQLPRPPIDLQDSDKTT